MADQNTELTPWEEYRRTEPTAVKPLLRLCPVCASEPELWMYSTTPSSPTTKVAMCSRMEGIGPEITVPDLASKEGCPLSFPPAHFYRATVREAIKFWNEYADALVALRISNMLKNE